MPSTDTDPPASDGCHSASPRAARAASTATFSGLPGGASVGSAGSGADASTPLPTPRRDVGAADVGYSARTAPSRWHGQHSPRGRQEYRPPQWRHGGRFFGGSATTGNRSRTDRTATHVRHRFRGVAAHRCPQ